MAAFEEKMWDTKYVHDFSEVQRKKVLHFLTGESIKNIQCTKCRRGHTIKSIDINQFSSYKMKALFTKTDIRMFHEKRATMELIYGNGDLLLNCGYCQCPICGNIISLGHFNDICQKNDHLYSHINSMHFRDPAKSTHRGIYYFIDYEIEILKRHEA